MKKTVTIELASPFDDQVLAHILRVVSDLLRTGKSQGFGVLPVNMMVHRDGTITTGVEGREGRAVAGSWKIESVPTITDEQLRELFARHCECRPLDLTRSDSDHAAVHDCDVGILLDVQLALGIVQIDDDFERGQTMSKARERCAEHLALVPNGLGGYAPLRKNP
jgi:hypothetical protein